MCSLPLSSTGEAIIIFDRFFGLLPEVESMMWPMEHRLHGKRLPVMNREENISTLSNKM